MRYVLLVGIVCASWACSDDSKVLDAGVVKTDLYSQPEQGAGGCSTANCSGCCRDGECLGGTDPFACGQGGMACATCGPSASCPAAICVEPDCDPTTCKDGCCDAAGACQQGRSAEVCGTGGADCAACTAEQGCVAGKCVDKGPPMHKVTLVSAKAADKMLVCGVTEFSACDLYVILKVGNVTAESSKIDNSNEPQWNEYLLTALDTVLIESFDVEVRDDDPVGSAEIGKCEPEITQEVLDAGELVTECGDIAELTFSFTPI